MWAQPTEQSHKIDGVAAVIGDEIVLDSDIQREFFYSQQQGESASKCEFLSNSLTNKLVLHHAKNDTLIDITNDQVERATESRVQDLINRAGGDNQRLLDFWGLNSMEELKVEIRQFMRDYLYVEKKQQLITSTIDATPEEVRNFFNEHKNELPDVPEELELAHIVIRPELEPKNKQKIIDQLTQIKQEVEDGASFSNKAILYSQGPTSVNGGLLPNVKRKQMVPEFDAVAFNLEEGQVSEPFETEFGFHIAYLEKRLGQTIDVRHILIKPTYTEEEISKAYTKLDSIRNLIITQKTTFKDAVREFSADKNTKYNGGNLFNPENGDDRFDRSKLPIKVLTAISSLKEGEISLVFEDDFEDKKSLRLLQVQRIIPRHQVNFETDFAKLKNFTISLKKEDVFKKWVQKVIPDTFIKIHPDYQNCDYQFNWNQ